MQHDEVEHVGVERQAQGVVLQARRVLEQDARERLREHRAVGGVDAPPASASDAGHDGRAVEQRRPRRPAAETRRRRSSSVTTTVERRGRRHRAARRAVPRRGRRPRSTSRTCRRRHRAGQRIVGDPRDVAR